MRELELYVHIPFCVKKCFYCDFLSAPADSEVREAYVKRLIEEIHTLAPRYAAYEVSSIYIGGGTPTILAPLQIMQLMDTLIQEFRVSEYAEITMEGNPGTVTGGVARTLRRSGINRLSLGLQSVHNGELKLLGRIHTYEDFLSSFEEARKAGFSNINVDLIFGLPGQSPADWRETVRKVVMLKPEHISAYSLMIEEGTPFYSRYYADELLREVGEEPTLLPGEGEEREMYETTVEHLTSHGYQHYEISNFARPGHICRHNYGYWTGKEYLGLGLGAASLVDDVRFRNTSDLEEYLSKPFERREEEPLDKKARIEEFMFLGLRLLDGISRQEFAERFSCEPEAVYGDTLSELEREGLLVAREGRIFLTARGIDVSNTVFARLLL